jgi:D-alanine-D-alanine ligase
MSTPTATTTPRRAAAERVADATAAVLLGGRSSEREVSLVSGAALEEALTAPHGDRRGPRALRRVEILADGRWDVGGRALSVPAALAELEDVDVFVLGLHGGEGEGGVLQGLLQSCGKRFTGAGVESSALCLDKTNARLVVAAHGLATARALAVTAAGWAELADAVLAELERWGGGWVTKPRHGGSSLGTRVVERAEDLAAGIEDALANGDDALVEELVRGVEATVGVIGNPQSGLRAFPPVEIRPHAGRFFDYEEKYSQQGAEEFCPPRSLERSACERLEECALRAYRALGCEGYARIDFLVPPGGEPVFLEANTLPGFTPRSLFPLAAAAAGLDFRSLCLELVDLALTAKRTPL